MTALINAGSLSLASILATVRMVDWREQAGENGDGYAVALPAITHDILDEHWPEWRDEVPRETDGEVPEDAAGWRALALDSGLLEGARVAELDAAPDTGWEAIARDLGLLDDIYEEDPADWVARAADEWQQQESFDEWRDSHEPQMNLLWPIDLAYMVEDHNGTRDEATLERIASAVRAAGATVLVVVDGGDFEPDTYGISLTGGGMDLSQDIAAAYVAAGHVPPVDLLRNISRGGHTTSKEQRAAIVAAGARASDWLRGVAEQFDRDLPRLIKPDPWEQPGAAA